MFQFKTRNLVVGLVLSACGFIGHVQAQQPYVGEIKLFAGNFAPMGWAFADGSLLEISQYDTLFALIGTTYGGDGMTTFALPDLRGRVPVHQSNAAVIGASFGSESVSITVANLPAQSRGDQATVSTQNIANAATALPARTAKTVDTQTSSGAGGGQPFALRAPYVGLNYIISLFGVFPSQY